MAKYYEFSYSAGYVGTDTKVIFKFDDSTTDKDIQEIYDDWYEEQRSDYGDFVEISEEIALEKGIEEDYTESEE